MLVSDSRVVECVIKQHKIRYIEFAITYRVQQAAARTRTAYKFLQNLKQSTSSHKSWLYAPRHLGCRDADQATTFAVPLCRHYIYLWLELAARKIDVQEHP